MIDQKILYSDCPCKSGKKFKFCCYNSIRDLLPNDPTRAMVADAIRERARSQKIEELISQHSNIDLNGFHKHIKRGLEYLHNSKFDFAEKEFLLAKEKFAFAPTPYNNLALSALIQGKLDEAEKIAREIIQRFPSENPFGMAIYADVQYLKGNTSEALEILEQAENMTPNSADHAIRVCESLAHFKAHQRIADYIIKYDYEDNPNGAFFLGIALANLGKESEAINHLRKTFQTVNSEYAEEIIDKLMYGEKPDTICGDWMYFTIETYSLSQCILKLTEDKIGSIQTSAEAISEFIEIQANEGTIEIKEAIKLLSQIFCKNAEKFLNALRLDETRPESIRKAAQKAYEKNYIKNKAGKILSTVKDAQIEEFTITESAFIPLPLEGNEEMKYQESVQIVLNPSSKKTEFKKSFSILEELHNKYPDSPQISNNYASALSRLGKYEEAKKIIRDCFAAHPEYVFGAANYLNILMSEKKFDEAKAMYDNYRLPKAVHPLAYLSWYNVATQYLALIDDKQTINRMKKLRNKIVKEFDL